MTKRVGVRAFLGALCAAFALPAMAQNLLQNPHFDGTLNPWIPFDTIYDADHSATADGTGSAAASVPDSLGIGNQALVIQQCVNGIVPGATYAFGGAIRIPPLLEAAGTAGIYLEWHAASNCSDDPGLGFAQTPFLSSPPGPTGEWVTLRGSSVAPAGATAVNFFPFAANDGPLQNSAPKIRPQAAVLAFAISIDDLFLDPLPAQVPTLGGVGIAVLLVSLAGAAFFFLRR